MKRIILMISCLIGFSFLYGQNNNNIEEITMAEVPIVNSEDISPISTDEFTDTLKISKWKDYWKLTGIIGLNFSQTQFWNWAAGGNNNANGVVHANILLAYKRDKLAWESNFDSEYGIMYTSGTNYAWRKSSDKINFSTKLGFEFKKTWFVTILGSFKSQYAAGYEYGITDATEYEKYISNWLSPSYSDLSIGIDWKANEVFSVYLSPIAGRVTTCTVDTLSFRETYGVDPELSYKADLGLTIKASVNYARIKNFKVLSTITLFTPYTSKIQKFGNFDVDWDLAISYQFLKVLNVSIHTSLKYYDQVMIADETGYSCARVQFKEIVGFGIGYSF